jgi:hypothetical protein
MVEVACGANVDGVKDLFSAIGWMAELMDFGLKLVQVFAEDFVFHNGN